MDATARLPDLNPEEERLTIRDITIAAEAQAKEGDTCYLVTQRWWQVWLDYVNQDMASNINNGLSICDPYHESHSSSCIQRPPVIDNSDLIYDAVSEVSTIGMELYDTLVEGRDYILLPELVWERLHGWYGGGPILPRRAISCGLSQTDLAIEVYPLRLVLILTSKGEQATIRISKKETIAQLHRKACEVFDVNIDQVCIWEYYGDQKHVLMDMEKTLEDASIQMDQNILVEIPSDRNNAVAVENINLAQVNGFIEKETSLVAPCGSTLSVDGLAAGKNISRSCSSEQFQYLTSPSNDVDVSHGTNSISTRGASLGLTGLLNLGNTCFMNSAIQCLVHTPEFTQYFQEDYHHEINRQNPLGTDGKLAKAFGELLRKLWAPGRTPVSPRPFKTKLAQFAPQFSGYNQHDSQELLAFLLDGLHEDLNRVKHKPYIKTRDADGRPDEEVANEYWANHIARNDSIIVDVCQGQYKSTLICPVCGKISVTFDPFMYLSLPLQFSSARTMTVVVFTSDGNSLPTSHTVNVPKQGRCKDLVQALSGACFLKSGEMLLLAEVRSHMIHHFLDDPLVMLANIKDDNLVAYKVQNMVNMNLLQFVHRHEELETGSSSSGLLTWKPYGTPLIAPVSCDTTITGCVIQAIAKKLLSPMIQNPQSSPSSFLNSSTATKRSPPDIGHAEACLSSFEDDLKGPDQPVSVSKLNLLLVDENKACIDLRICEREVLNLPTTSHSVVVFINWSQEDLEEYNTHHFESLPEAFKYSSAPKRARNEPLSLYACLNAFLREEPLVPEDMWYCPQCKERRQASKKLDLWRLPEVLVIHLKRFSFSRSTKHKLEVFVNFPIHDFDLTNYVAHKNSSHRQLYELYALSNHYGSMASGHYTAYIKLLDENRWYNFDDSHVSCINEDEVKSSAAYVLFYRRVKGDDP